MNLSSIEFLIQEAFTGIRRNGLMAFASISTVALSLGVLGAFVLVALGANHFTTSQIGKFEIAVYMRAEANRAQTDAVASQVKKITDVQSVKTLSKDEEWARVQALESEHRVRGSAEQSAAVLDGRESVRSLPNHRHREQDPHDERR